VLVGLLVQRAARRFAARVALEGPQGTHTYAELGDRVARLAGGLLGLGLRPGDRVLDLQPNQNTSVETDLACCTAGLVRVALNYRLHPDDWARIADDCGASALVYDARYAQPATALREGLKYVVAIGDAPGASYEQLIRAGAPVRPEARPDDLVSLNYTSGTTGRPKGVQRTHRVRFASLVNMVADVVGTPPGPRDTYLHAGPITHTSGLFVLPFLAYGARQLILPSFDAAAVVEAVRERGATHTALVPTMVARLLAHGAPVHGLKMLGYAGAPMPAEQIRQAHERLSPNLVQYYGLVEAIPPVTVLDAADHAAGLAGRTELLTSAGRPALGVELEVVDEAGRRVPVGEVGEVVTRGDHVMPGYWGNAGDSARAVDGQGWLHTGDLGRLDGSGRLWLVDRKGDMIITGGYNVYPREVEDVIAEVPGVREIAVIGVADPEWGQRIVALYTGPATPAEIEAHCRARLASYKKPKEVHRVDSFPVNATGKIAKNVLRASYPLPGPRPGTFPESVDK
jgi:acyl-CoA synthetase (AMP-forming)/AMP-acid ligase II